MFISCDFNAPHIPAFDHYDTKSYTIMNFRHLLDLSRFSCIKNHQNRLLDLFISNFECEIAHDDCPLVVEDNYHPALNIILRISLRTAQVQVSEKVYNFKRANFPALYQDILDADWNVLCDSNKVIYVKLYQIFSKIIVIIIRRGLIVIILKT